MFCTNCGSKVNDDAVFCTNCGAKIKKMQIGETETTAEKSAVNHIPAANYIPEAVPVMRPVQEIVPDKQELAEAKKEEVIPVNISIQPVPTLQQARIPEEANINSVPVNIAGHIEGTVKEKSIILPLVILSVIFSVLTIASGVIEMLDKTSEIQDIARIIEVCIASVIIVIYAVTNNKTTFLLKGIAISILMICDIIFVGYNSISYAIKTFGDSAETIAKSNGISEGLVITYLIAVLVWFGAMYIFYILDAVRSFLGTRKAKIITLFFGYIAVLAVIMQIIFKAVIEDGTKLFMGFLPMNLIYVFLLMSIMFGISSKKKTARKK